MLALPPIAPMIDAVASVRRGRDYYVRVAGNDYSVDPGAIGQIVDVHTTLTHIRVNRSGRLLADHHGCRAARQTITAPAHVETRRTTPHPVP